MKNSITPHDPDAHLVNVSVSKANGGTVIANWSDETTDYYYGCKNVKWNSDTEKCSVLFDTGASQIIN